MRILAAMLLIGLASEAWAKSDISGMLACNPNDENKKPVIYVFDGEYLLRDNDLAYPFRNIASLPQKTEMYFSYAHSRNQLLAWQANVESLLSQWARVKDEIRDIHLDEQQGSVPSAII